MARRKKQETEWDYPRYRPAPVELPDNAMDAVPELRSFAAMMWEEAGMLFGGPADLVRQVFAPRSFVHLARNWIRHLELLVRRMLLIMALSMTLAPVRPSRPRTGEPRSRGGNWQHPASWKVRFRIIGAYGCSDRERVARRPRPPARPKQILPTAGLARRLEALRRAVSYHHAYAQRLARSLTRFRVKNARRNAPRALGLRKWDFNPWRDSKAAAAVNDGMRLGQPVAERLLAAWQPDLLSPG